VVITFVSEIGEQLCEFHFRVPGLKAAGHRPFDQMLRLCGAHAVAKEIGIARKSSSGAREIALTRSLTTT
jgi:hypothetical protein